MTTFYVPAIGAIDGVNTTFTAGTSYIPGSMVHHLNGSIKTPADTDGIIETNPTAGIVDLKVPPRVGDRVILVVNNGIGTEVTTGISAIVRINPSVDAVIAQDVRLVATVSAAQRIAAEITQPSLILATIKTPRIVAEVICE